MSVRFRALSGSIAAGLRRLITGVHLDPVAYARRQRLVGVLLFSPLILTAAMAMVLPVVFGPGVAVAASSAVFALAWLGGLHVAQHGYEKPVMLTALAMATLSLAVLVATGGGLASPVALLLCTLAFEPWWIVRSRVAARFGLAAMALAAAGSVLLAGSLPSTPAAVWHWLPSLIYLASVGARLARDFDQKQSAAPSFEDRLPAAILGVAANGDILWASARSEEILGLERDLLGGQALFERLHVGDRVAYMCALSDVRNGLASRQLELRVRLPGATEESAYRLLTAEIVNRGDSDCAVVLRPAPEMEMLHRRLGETREEVDRLTLAKSSFLASVSHELRTPLNAIIGFSDMLAHELYGGFADPRQREHVVLIRDAGTHLLAVVNSILDVSKIELSAYDINPEPFVFADAVAMCSAMLGAQADNKRIHLETRVDPSIGEVNADRRAVQQMLINLVSNALKFTDEGGRVVVDCARDGDMVEFLVRDNGVGIADEDMARLGQPFVQLSTDYSRRHEGTGLGLALVKGLVKLHGGSFAVTSRLGSGTTVTIRLPGAGACKLDAGAAARAIDGDKNGAYLKTA